MIKTNIKNHIIDAVIETWRQNGAQHRIPIVGSSMYPFVKAGDHILITHDCSKICLGDIVVFRRNEALFAHRVVKILKTGMEFACITKGDNATLCDLPVNGQEIMGRVLAISRGNRQIGCEGIIWRMAGRCVVFYTGICMWLDDRGYFIPGRYAAQSTPRFASVVRRASRILFLLVRFPCLCGSPVCVKNEVSVA
ncbi:MAG: signal peptidase I [Planctomycetota bacterium]